MTTLSNRQYPLLKHFIDASQATGTYHMPLEDAATFDQRPFRSLLMRGWITFAKGRGFRLTADGKRAWVDFQATSIVRSNPHSPLCAWFYSHFPVGAYSSTQGGSGGQGGTREAGAPPPGAPRAVSRESRAVA